VAVQAIKSEQKCKLCRHDERVRIDELLEKRSLRQKDADGVIVNLEYVLAAFREMGVENPTLDNIKIHWKKHCRQVSDKQAAEEEAQRADLLEKILSGEIELADIDESVRVMFTLGVEEVKDRARRGEKTGITIDHVIKFGDLLTKRRHNEKTEEMMAALGGAVAQVYGGMAQGQLPPAPDEIEAGPDDVIEDGDFDE
jgi:hypothetical protein